MSFHTISAPIVYSLKPRIIAREFTIHNEPEKKDFFGTVWHSRASSGVRPLLLLGHQEDEDRHSPDLMDFMHLMCGKYGFVVAAIDGPMHGDRRVGTVEQSMMKHEFDQAWRDGEETITPMVMDWKLTIDALCELTEVDARHIGYFGLSMGTAYGLEVVATDLRISAAIFGQWGTNQAHHERLLKYAKRINCPVDFYAFVKDPNLIHQKNLLETFRSEEKQWITYAKSGFFNNPKQVEMAKDFFVLHLLDNYLY
jgi:hypothetical protein